MEASPIVVIYDEDHQTCSLLKEWLAEAGYRVQIGSRCDPGVEGPCNLIIASIHMPKNAGGDHLRGIQDAHPGIPVLATSGQLPSGETARGAAAQALKVRQVIAKPLMRKELLQAVRGIIAF